MLSISCKHPEADKFVSAKLEQGKVTGANISIKFDDEFMECVTNKSKYFQYFPIFKDRKEIIPENVLNGSAEAELDKLYEGLTPGTCYKVIDAKKLWDKVVFNAWRSAEPGILFWSSILNNTASKPYFNKGFLPTSTNPLKIQSGFKIP